ncbi:MAG: HNH endonuclease [Anaerovoracaceae bacterium]
MKIANQLYKILDTFDNIVTIPDCFVLGKNKLGAGHGEAKLYFSTKKYMKDFFGKAGFAANCFILKQDLVSYLNLLKFEYTNPSQNYIGKEEFPLLWENRMKMVSGLDEIISFTVADQTQIAGARGYVNSNDFGYKLIREISLPLVSYLSVMQLSDNEGKILYYWKLFVDFDAISERKNGPLVFTYGKKVAPEAFADKLKVNPNEQINYARCGQGKYRDALLEECPFCPITMVNDERLLIASHIKPWAVSNDQEKIDPKNGYMLTPLYDKLFDRGFITFTVDKHMKLSNWLSPKNCQRLKLKDGAYCSHLPMDPKRMEYLEYHRTSVFKG